VRAYFMIQYSSEWWTVRRGVPTASQFDKIITPKGWEPSKGAATYIAELCAETADLRPNWFSERPMNPAQRHGLDTEPKARRYYEYALTEAGELDRVQQVGFIHTDDGRFGASPDGLVWLKDGRRGALELKCPQLNTQSKYLLKGDLPASYKPQVHGQLLIGNFDFVDFLSYAEGLDPLLIRVFPDEDTLKLRDALESFNLLYNAALAKLGLRRFNPNDWKPEPEVPTVGTPAEVSNPWEEPIGPFADGVPG